MAKNIVPTRMCSGCMIRRPKEELMRVVKNSDGSVSASISLYDYTLSYLSKDGAYTVEDADSISAYFGGESGVIRIKYENEKLLSAGGRVLGVVDVQPTLKEAVDGAYAKVSKIFRFFIGNSIFF